MTRLKLLREESGKLQKEVAAALNVTQSAYSAWELGKNTPDLESLYALADMFGSSLDYMLGYSADRHVDLGRADRLIFEYLLVKHGLEPTPGQRVALEAVLDDAVQLLSLK
jgi:transcriptional regulator with XRE-family HTH domain